MVLDFYKRQFAFCPLSIRLGVALLGIVACHVKPIQHFGDDPSLMALHFAKVHHWALDRGAIGISENRELLVSTKLNGNKINEFFHEFTNKSIFTPRNIVNHLYETNVKYHREFVFEGGEGFPFTIDFKISSNLNKGYLYSESILFVFAV